MTRRDPRKDRALWSNSGAGAVTRNNTRSCPPYCPTRRDSQMVHAFLHRRHFDAWAGLCHPDFVVWFNDSEQRGVACFEDLLDGHVVSYKVIRIVKELADAGTWWWSRKGLRRITFIVQVLGIVPHRCCARECA